MWLIFPIGGNGARFRAAGYTIPKPLITVRGKTLLEYAWSSYPDAWKTFAILSPENSSGSLVSLITGKRTGKFCMLGQSTKGPLETMAQGLFHKQTIAPDEEVLIADCDSFFEQPGEVTAAMDWFHSRHADGGVTIQVAESPAYSYAVTGGGAIVRETAEKRLISKNWTTGPYWFRRWDTFKQAAEYEMNHQRYTVSPCYNWLIDQGKVVVAYPTTSFVHLGSPEELDAFNLRPRIQPS